MTVTLSRPVVKKCPYRDEIDTGTLTIILSGPAPELHALAAAVETLCQEPISHEAFTERVAMILPKGAQVVTTWNTGPWSVEVTGHAPGEEG